MSDSIPLTFGVVGDESRSEPDPDRVSPTTITRTLQKLPRRKFVTSSDAVGDTAVFLPPTRVLGSLIGALELRKTDRVLEVGTGSGYATAALAKLAARVYSAEFDEGTATDARTHLQGLELDNVKLRVGDGIRCWKEQAPFDAILVSARTTRIADELLQQLTIGGRLVAHIGPNRANETLVRVRRAGEEQFENEILEGLAFVTELTEALREMGIVRDADIEAARKAAARSGNTIEHELLNLPRVDVTEVYRGIARIRHQEFATLDRVLERLDHDCATRVPRSFLRHNDVLPVCESDGKLRVVTSSLHPNAALSELRQVFQPKDMEVLLVTPADFQRLWTSLDLSLSGEPLETTKDQEVADLLAGEEELDAHFVSIFEAILLEAIFLTASDIHLERYEKQVRVRMRVDGSLRDVPRFRLSPRDMLGVVNVIKIRANLDIAEHRLPQGGRIRLRAGAEHYDLRVQVQPTLYAEHVVVRLLPQDQGLVNIEDLGFPSESAKLYQRLLGSPSGLLLVVGPTGSGKTTTLYGGLKLLADDATRKVLTIEDPIEYAISGVQQSQARPNIGFHFADAMRSFVRQDPDVILVGEIRDGETALEAIRASQTGHLVLSTLHCNDTVDAVQRLLDLGMDPNSVSSELLAVISQRLAKRVCEHCRRPAEADPAILAELFPADRGGPPAEFESFVGAGCPHCHDFGTHGRIACVEMLTANTRLRRAISHRTAVDDLRELALEIGLVPLRDHAVAHVNAGTIPLSELPRILPAERMAPERARAHLAP